MNNIPRIPLILLFLIFLTPALSFAQDNETVSGILLDNTGTMRLQFDEVLKLGSAAADMRARNGAVSLFCFETSGKGRNAIAVIADGSEWSQDNDVLDTYLSYITVVSGHTSLRDAIRSVAESVNRKASSENITKKFVVLITDGDDRVSNISEKDLIGELKDMGVKVYAIGLVEQLDSYRGNVGQSTKSRAEHFLKELTEKTGGNVIFPKIKKDTKIEDLLDELFPKMPDN